ncbi:MAG: glycosyltransferase, partial [Acidobacteriaceae bacterium]|nr:glycosyltransferase [Acidobacteriaceae bacterium]
ELSRNFGSFAAITAGLEAASGEFFAVMAADLQEPPELVDQFFRILADDRADIVFGTREGRSDSFLSDLLSTAFWSIYRVFVLKDMPEGGVDVFGCNRLVRDRLLQFKESTSNLIALLLWMGFRRAFVPYRRRRRIEGRSAWTIHKKLRYCINSIFNFTDLPIQLLLYSGSVSLVMALVGTVVLVIAKLTGHISVPGYTPIVLAIFFFGALTSLGLGIIGQYIWLNLQHTRARPNYIVHRIDCYVPEGESQGVDSIATSSRM